ncbi:MAG: iron-sulfur cluster assembly accessory protein [Gammaproteobacteria bacterium HGW-Gammaproteobacteria-14]|nr:MAG: iron-sulfur cluster assembly accessory protein [Gammaproteobacteria bacterium HGW-Gammaproteobacteria-14]
MSVQTYMPGDVSIRMTPSAESQARKEIKREAARGLRLAVKPSGCSGFMYVLDYVRGETADDKPIAIADDVTLFIDSKSVSVVNGTEIDYVTEGVNSFFKFRNPNATGECGCGESFTVNA